MSYPRVILHISPLKEKIVKKKKEKKRLFLYTKSDGPVGAVIIFIR